MYRQIPYSFGFFPTAHVEGSALKERLARELLTPLKKCSRVAKRP